MVPGIVQETVHNDLFNDLEERGIDVVKSLYSHGGGPLGPR
jgi:hypothetical protein